MRALGHRAQVGRKLSHEQNRLMRTKVRPAPGKTTLLGTSVLVVCKINQFLHYYFPLAKKLSISLPVCGRYSDHKIVLTLRQNEIALS